MKENNLKVFINKINQGELFYENDLLVFNYSQDAKDIVSLTMPIRSNSWINKKLHPIFQMNLPEGSLKDAIKTHFSKIKKMDDLGLLKLVGPHMLGRVKFNEVAHNKKDLKLEDILENNSLGLFQELLDKFAISSGVSGVQPKILLSAHNKNTMKFEHYIVKSWTSEFDNLALNEYFCMKAIKYSKLTTPEFYISDNNTMFIMKRFDVKEDNTYFGFEDMCVLTGRNTEDKYEGSCEEITRVIKDNIATHNRKQSLKDFFKATIMNHFLRNGDGHLKNYGILYDKDFQDASLAPIYDVITTTIYFKKDIPALKISDVKLWWKEKTYKNFAKQSCALTNKEYKEIIKDCKNAITKAKIDIDIYIKDKNKDQEFLNKLKNTWIDQLN
ncbi:MAG: type II toxin-antitoxin system HipA family toxin [Campylobacteraceae bacterium]|nr:type II toxin-antitoxin system HipA family toxin [Campylobacteraceae bacterium]